MLSITNLFCAHEDGLDARNIFYIFVGLPSNQVSNNFCGVFQELFPASLSYTETNNLAPCQINVKKTCNFS